MATARRPKDTYRKHPRVRALHEARPEIVRLILKRIGERGMRASGIRQATGMPSTDDCLLALRDGNLDGWSDNRLLLLGERLGLRPRVTFH